MEQYSNSILQLQPYNNKYHKDLFGKSLLKVLMLVAVRKVMEKIFSLNELEVLDDLMPENIKKRKAEEEALHKKDDDYYGEDDDECEDNNPDGKKVKIGVTCSLTLPCPFRGQNWSIFSSLIIVFK